ncbi:Ribonuclease P protein component [Desulfosarcina cetonica]|uniref:ribonuclease P protein component n=1 Tax=Desulfosarcina cetonica TaxID=90730 RepID=UPI0006D11757|nr:ribonuclease P protein component [Desulfosarcina cetonica]VTR69037.1 Ribonuclease P protein component [Desulfosarcina cetonica]
MNPQVLKKEDKLRKRYEFITLSEFGEKKFYKNIIIIYRKNDLSNSRIGITVSKKVGNAVVRNKIKRIIREFFRKSRMLYNNNYDINIIVRKKIKNCDHSDLKKELELFQIKIGK